MDLESLVENLDSMLSDLATQIARSCLPREPVMEIYLGQSMPDLPLALYRPLFLENTAYCCFLIVAASTAPTSPTSPTATSRIKLAKLLWLDAQEISDQMGLDSDAFATSRMHDYEAAPDTDSLYNDFCAHVVQFKTNAHNATDLEDIPGTFLERKTLLAVSESAATLREAAQAVFAEPQTR